MKIRLVWPGKTKLAWAAEGIDDYIERSSRFLPVEERVVRAAGRGSAQQKRDREAEAILGALPEVGYTVVLDERGRQLDSRAFSRLVGDRMLEGRDLSFVVGGAEGLTEAVRERADSLLALSKLTFPHDLARLVLAEQVYRALAILRDHPYPR